MANSETITTRLSLERSCIQLKTSWVPGMMVVALGTRRKLGNRSDDEKLYFPMLSFIHSFASFPRNLIQIGSRILRMSAARR